MYLSTNHAPGSEFPIRIRIQDSQMNADPWGSWSVSTTWSFCTAHPIHHYPNSVALSPSETRFSVLAWVLNDILMHSYPKLVYSFLVKKLWWHLLHPKTRKLVSCLVMSTEIGSWKNNIHSGRVCVIIIVIQKYTFAFQRVNITNLTSRIKCTLFARNYFRCLFCTSRGFTFAGARQRNHSAGLIMT
jgi:hypothetical protein